MKTITMDEFLKLFQEAINQYFQSEILFEPVEPGKTDDPIIAGADKCKRIKIKGCDVNIYILIKTRGHYSLRGVWIIIKHPFPTAFHFPFNTGINVIMNVYDKNVGQTLNGIIDQFLFPLFGNHDFFKHPLYSSPISIKSFIEAFDIISDYINKHYCKGGFAGKAVLN